MPRMHIELLLILLAYAQGSRSRKRAALADDMQPSMLEVLSSQDDPATAFKPAGAPSMPRRGAISSGAAAAVAALLALRSEPSHASLGEDLSEVLSKPKPIDSYYKFSQIKKKLKVFIDDTKEVKAKRAKGAQPERNEDNANYLIAATRLEPLFLEDFPVLKPTLPADQQKYIQTEFANQLSKLKSSSQARKVGDQLDALLAIDKLLALLDTYYEQEKEAFLLAEQEAKAKKGLKLPFR